MTLEILHNIQKPVVHVGLVDKSYLDLIQITEGILYQPTRVRPYFWGSGGGPKTDIQNRLLALGEGRHISRNLLSLSVVAHHGRGTRVLHVRPWCTLAMLRHLRAEEASWTTGRLHISLRTIGWVVTETRKETVRAVDRIRDLRGDRLVQGNGARVALNRVVIALAFHLLAFHLFALALLTLPVGHLFLALALKDLAFPGVPLALAVQRLGRCMLHGLADTRERMTGTVRRALGVLSVGRLVRSPVALAQFC